MSLQSCCKSPILDLKIGLLFTGKPEHAIADTMCKLHLARYVDCGDTILYRVTLCLWIQGFIMHDNVTRCAVDDPECVEDGTRVGLCRLCSIHGQNRTKEGGKSTEQIPRDPLYDSVERAYEGTEHQVATFNEWVNVEDQAQEEIAAEVEDATRHGHRSFYPDGARPWISDYLERCIVDRRACLYTELAQAFNKHFSGQNRGADSLRRYVWRSSDLTKLWEAMQLTKKEAASLMK